MSVPVAEKWLGCLMANFLAGKAAFPSHMGLGKADFTALAARLPAGMRDTRDATQLAKEALLSELLQPRLQERDELAGWLAGYACPGSQPMALLLANASLGFNHLWQDLGLVSRAQLRELMTDCFPELVRLNQHNMRWKKFFYRQLCELDGHYVCRSPSCEACSERASCFEPSD